MNTYDDASYLQSIAQSNRSTYMMSISPLFYTNLPGLEKNWSVSTKSHARLRQFLILDSYKLKRTLLIPRIHLGSGVEMIFGSTVGYKPCI
jgi:hypothetical protein